MGFWKKAPPPRPTNAIETKSIAHAPHDRWIHVRGALHGDQLLQSPLHDAPCVHYELLVMAWIDNGSRTVATESAWAPRVVLRDGSAEVRLSPERAFVALRVGEMRDHVAGTPLPPAVSGLLVSQQVMSRERLRYRETTLEDGALVFARGRIVGTEDGALELVGDDEEEVTITVDEAFLSPV